MIGHEAYVFQLSIVKNLAFLHLEFLGLFSLDDEMSSDTLQETEQPCLPPQSLLVLVANWITSQPGISLTPYPQQLVMLPNCRAPNQDMAVPAPTASTRKLPLTPILGLIR